MKVLDSPATDMVPAAPAHDRTCDRASVACNECAAPLRTEYFHVRGSVMCAMCTARLEREAAPLQEWLPVLRGAVFGLAAAMLGAAIYYSFVTITDFELGLIAIVSGYLVGWAVRRGAGGRGGRRLQVAAVAMTYVSMALAYTPLVTMHPSDEELARAATAPEYAMIDGAATDGWEPAPVSYAANVGPIDAGDLPADASPLNPVEAAGVVAIFVLALPLFVVFGSMPVGLLSGVIIAFGMRQAWKMTGVHRVKVEGPFPLAGQAPG